MKRTTHDGHNDGADGVDNGHNAAAWRRKLAGFEAGLLFGGWRTDGPEDLLDLVTGQPLELKVEARNIRS